MEKAEFFQQCLLRHPGIKKDVLTFHQMFPPVFVRESNQSKQFPNSLKSILKLSRLKDAFGRALYIGRPRTFEDLKKLHSKSMQIEGFKLIAVGEGKYYEVVKKKPYQYDRMLKQYLEKWPGVKQATFLHGVFEPYRPTLLVTGFPLPGGTSGDLKRDLNSMADRVKIWIPIYDDTCSGDINWKEIAHLQSFIYGEKRRLGKEPGSYERYLEVFDLRESDSKRWTWPKIAKRIFPKEFRDPNKMVETDPDQKQESKIKLVKHYYDVVQSEIERIGRGVKQGEK